MFKRIICLTMAFFVLMSSVVLAYDESTINSKSAILGDSESGFVMFEHNADEKLPIASMTKIMTMLLTMEAIDSGRIKLDDIVVVSENAAKKEGSHVFLSVGENISVHDLLKAVAVASGNDAATALAEYVGGNLENFIQMMNEKAKELNMTNTNFVNCNGLDAENHYSSARDVFIMSKELLKHSKITEYTTIWMDSLRNGTFTLANTNKLVRHYDGTTGLKTGSTSVAGFCVSASAKRNDMHLLSVVIGADSSKHRFADASNLLNYGFNSYKSINKGEKGQIHKYIEIEKSKNKLYPVVYKESINLICEKATNEKEIKTEEIIYENLKAPIEANTKVGEVIVKKGEKVLAKTDLITNEKVEKINLMLTMCMLTTAIFN